jgi:hypothetical protein
VFSNGTQIAVSAMAVVSDGKEASKMNGPDWTYWLQMMNFAMVAVVVLAGITVIIPAFWELQKRLRHAGEVQSDDELSVILRADSHHIAVPELGLTMADGGEELKDSDQETGNTKSQRR